MQDELDLGASDLVQSLLRPAESVSHLDSRERDEISVYLITKAAAARARQKKSLGLPGGSGRVLKLKRIDGKWSVVGEASWIA